MCTDLFKGRSETLLMAAEGYFKAYPKLYLSSGIEAYIRDAPDLADAELEALGAKIFKGKKAAKLVANGRS